VILILLWLFIFDINKIFNAIKNFAGIDLVEPL